MMMQQEHPLIPSLSDDPGFSPSSIKPGQSIVSSVHRAKISNGSILITVTWSRNLFGLHGLSLSLQSNTTITCKVALKPWCFWRKQGSKKFGGGDEWKEDLHVFWDLRGAKFSGEAGPRSGYYVALVCAGEVVLLLGDMTREAYKRTGCRAASAEAALVSRKEHVFGKRRFATTARFGENGRRHEIVIECGGGGGGGEARMVVRVDGEVAIEVKHLQWKFRGNETVRLGGKERVEVYWDVHDWLFIGPAAGLMSHALFIFKPLPVLHSSLLSSGDHHHLHQGVIAAAAPPPACLFLYAWKIE